MAAGNWKVYGKAIKKIGNGTINLSGVFKLQLHTSAAATNIAALSTRSLNTEVGNEVAAAGGYPAGGKALLAVKWSALVSAKRINFSYTTAGWVQTASGSTIANIRFALIRNSTGAGTGHVVAFVSLSTAQFNLTSPNILTILPNSPNGVFYIA
jgi:hypothetical protein